MRKNRVRFKTKIANLLKKCYNPFQCFVYFHVTII